jgi:hypothetical protein
MVQDTHGSVAESCKHGNHLSGLAKAEEFVGLDDRLVCGIEIYAWPVF